MCMCSVDVMMANRPKRIIPYTSCVKKLSKEGRGLARYIVYCSSGAGLLYCSLAMPCTVTKMPGRVMRYETTKHGDPKP